MDAEGPLCLRVVPVELPPGLVGVGAGGGALGVDGDVDQVGIPILPGRLKDLGKDVGVELGVGGDLGSGQEQVVKLLRGKIETVAVLFVAHGDGEGEHLNAQLLPHRDRDIGGGVGGKFYTSHYRPPHPSGKIPIVISSAIMSENTRVVKLK